MTVFICFFYFFFYAESYTAKKLRELKKEASKKKISMIYKKICKLRDKQFQTVVY